jgi:hypothetical protein
MTSVAVVSLSRELNSAGAVFGVGVALGILLKILLGPLCYLEGEMGDDVRWWWQLWLRAARVVRGAGVALALVAAGRWAIHRWFPTAQHELDVALIGLAIMVLWEAGSFEVGSFGPRPEPRVPEKTSPGT